LASPESYAMTQGFFLQLADLADAHKYCPMKSCRRKRRCTAPPMSACSKHVSPLSLEGRRLRIGMPFCFTVIWEHVRHDVWRLLNEDMQPDEHG
ncbi:MAG: hypothetical protein ACR2O8_17915, partial [Rhizobiaceae bacterium]